MAYAHTTVGNAFVVVWGTAKLDDLGAVMESVRATRRSAQRPLVYVAVIPPGTDAPDDETRWAMMDGMEELLQHCSSVHFVVEGDGFRHVLHRSALSGVLLIGGKRGRVFVHRTTRAALNKASQELVGPVADVLAKASAIGADVR